MWDKVAARWWHSIDADFQSPMCRWSRQNFGDEPLNRVLLSKLFPNLNQEANHPKYILLGIGSILGMRSSCMRPNETNLPLLVYGSGYQYGEPSLLPEDSKVFCVRGNYTCETFGFDKSCAVADPAILLPKFFPRDVQSIAGRTARIYRWSHGLNSKEMGESLNLTTLRLKFWDTCRSISDTRFSDIFTARTEGDFAGWLRRLWSCERIETESLHAAIVADAYGIPWRPLMRRWHRKWNDHFSMLGIEEKPRTFTLSNRKKMDEKAEILMQRREDLIHHVENL